MREAFLQQLLQGFSNYDRQLRFVFLEILSLEILINYFLYRNDILIIAIQLAQEMPQLPFIESGFAKELLLFATYPESTFISSSRLLGKIMIKIIAY